MMVEYSVCDLPETRPLPPGKYLVKRNYEKYCSMVAKKIEDLLDWTCLLQDTINKADIAATCHYRKEILLSIREIHAWAGLEYYPSEVIPIFDSQVSADERDKYIHGLSETLANLDIF